MKNLSLSDVATVVSLATSAITVIVFLARIGPALNHLAEAISRLTNRDDDKETRLARLEGIVESLRK